MKPLIVSAALFALTHCSPAPAAYLDEVLTQRAPYPANLKPQTIAWDANKRFAFIRFKDVDQSTVDDLATEYTKYTDILYDTWCPHAKGAKPLVIRFEFASVNSKHSSLIFGSSLCKKL